MKKYLLTIFSLGAAVFFLSAWKIQNNPPLCGNNCQESFTLQIENDTTGIFHQQTVKAPNVAIDEKESNILGTADPVSEKHIYVDLTNQILSAYDGDKLFMKTPISSGLWGRTPTGDYTIWTKLRATRMTGGQGADYYNLPNVPYVMFFSNNQVPASAGFGLHGTYWHNNFGHPMSHGCVNMKTTDAAKLFNWVDKLGTKIKIFGEEI